MTDTPQRYLGLIPLRTVRIVAEILIIVVGVMIALTADALYQNGVERSMAEGYVARLEADLRADSALFESLLGGLSKQAAAVDSLVLILGDLSAEPDGSRVLRYLRETILLPFGSRARATFDDIVGSGRLALIEDDQLRIGLGRYYSAPIVRDQSGYDAYLNASYYPYLHQLTLALGVRRMHAMGNCDLSDQPEAEAAYMLCFEQASLGDELILVRTDRELAAYVSDQVMQRFFAFRGVIGSLDIASRLLEQIQAR